MSWVRLDDVLFDDPVFEEIGAEACMLHFSALAFSARNLSDGLIDRRSLRKLYPVSEVMDTVKALEDSGLWQRTDDGWLINTWAQHLRTREAVEADRAANRQRQANWQAKIKANKVKAAAAAVDSTGPNGVTNAVTNGVTNGPPTLPVPARPDPKGGEGKGRVAPAQTTNTSALTESAALAATESFSVDTGDDDGAGLTVAFNIARRKSDGMWVLEAKDSWFNFELFGQEDLTECCPEVIVARDWAMGILGRVAAELADEHRCPVKFNPDMEISATQPSGVGVPRLLAVITGEEPEALILSVLGNAREADPR